MTGIQNGSYSHHHHHHNALKHCHGNTGHAPNVSGDLSSPAKGTKYVYTWFLGIRIPSLLPLTLSAFLCDCLYDGRIGARIVNLNSLLVSFCSVIYSNIYFLPLECWESTCVL